MAEPLRQIGIVGLGLMGSSLGLAIRAAQPEAMVVGVDSDPQVVRKALQRGYVHEAGSDVALVKSLHLVILAAPIASLSDLLRDLTGAGGVVTDLASVKVAVMAWASEAGVDLVGGHPMCGRELSGIDAARADLYQGAPWILTRPEPRVLELVELVGARAVVMDAERHDRLVAGVSHAAYMLAVAYMLAASSSEEWTAMAQLAAGGFRDMTRLAAGDPAMYEAIARHNSAHLDAWLSRVEESIAEMRAGLGAGNDRLASRLEQAKRARDDWAAGRS
jgi:prephenate dehydrogenase